MQHQADQNFFKVAVEGLWLLTFPDLRQSTTNFLRTVGCLIQSLPPPPTLPETVRKISPARAPPNPCQLPQKTLDLLGRPAFCSHAPLDSSTLRSQVRTLRFGPQGCGSRGDAARAVTLGAVALLRALGRRRTRGVVRKTDPEPPMLMS